MIRAVIDTNVLFSGLTNDDNTSDLVVQAWHAKLFQACVSTAVALEYDDVLSRKLSSDGWQYARRALRTLLDLAAPVAIHFSWRPASNDPGDNLIIDCALNANAIVVTYNKRDFRLAQRELGLQVMNAAEFLELLSA